ncbi:ATP-grasp domain-containing protein [Thalassoglobus polymorphus]|uniref:Carbamoyl phosphate synthase-like protein n=1 Tax=Thalassoglobus polymorphus TaxID=2527994 RepID=A0A517QUE3_9PLAN|nr:ATP-grasp domain-containing protein [Thalassoglobus polymorphus]QDT35225.1 carbamoyl phosphate synthase-like protein [Thalassoglobus polymorphus]
MRLFLYEDLCGGGCDEFLEFPSLKREGLAMLNALIHDFSLMPSTLFGTNLQLITHWDVRHGTAPFQDIHNLQVVNVREEQADEAFAETLKHCDAALVVAPETGMRLQQLCELVERSNCRSLNSSSAAIHLCGEKLLFAQHLEQAKITTIPTSTDLEELPMSSHYVRKPRDGAGSSGVQLFSEQEARAASIRPVENTIWQPFISGQPCSMGCFHNAGTGDLLCLPIAKQHLSEDGQFQYQGGEIPLVTAKRSAATQVVQSLVDSVTGLNGYFGVDMILTSAGEVVIVEVNPRLTTSYVGYRKMTKTNLAECFFEVPDAAKIDWVRHITFQPNGETQGRTLNRNERDCGWY